MRVFVAGATGVAGRRAVAQLVAAGHEVTGIARTPEKEARLRALGARPVGVSLFDPGALRAAVAGHDAVVNLATKIPPLAKAARAAAWAENERIRREASGHLVDAAIAAGAKVFVQESLAFLYGEHGDEWVDAATTPWHPSQFTEAMGVAEANAARFTEHGGRGVVLRFGRFYAPDSDQMRTIVQAARRGIALDFGTRDAYAPAIDADDVATAVVAALDAPAGTYDVVDDEPLTRAEHDRALATAVGRRRLRRLPGWMTPKKAAHLGASQRVSNRRFREATGWAPSSPSMREGFAKLVARLQVQPALGGGVRAVLWVLALSALVLGAQATFMPRAFYDDFPLGRGWVAADGPYNEHLLRDFGALQLALFVMLAGALWQSTRTAARVAGIATLVFAVPHFAYHAAHLEPYGTADQVGNVVTLASMVVGGLFVVVFANRTAARSATVATTPQYVPGELTPAGAHR
jgi:nucleoside-diphosphate-sugar epimerase